VTGIDTAPFQAFVQNLAGGASVLSWAWQLGVGAIALLVGWWVAHRTCREIRPSGRWKFGAGDFERVAYPLIAWVFLMVAKGILARFQPVALLDIAQSLLLAWLAIRIAVYVLGHILPEGGFLRAAVRTVAWVAWIGVALHITGLLPEVTSTLDDLGITMGKNHQRITLLLVLQVVGALALTLTVAAWIARITETRVMAAKHVEMSTRVVIAKLVRTAALFLAVLIALPMVGIDITTLAIFGSALGVGLGFGLQKIASNYVSGFIVLLDRSLHIGDLITVDTRRGVVTAIESRYTVVKGTDGTEYIVPNEKLITDTVNHHTFSDPKVAVVVPITVGYEADVEKALAILVECARDIPAVLADPKPIARAKLFKDHGVELELVCWIADVVVGDADVRSDLLRDILKRFASAGLEIPYPRRDVHLLRSAGATVATPESPSGSVL
jgi:small-conductance mechanosensitive channel